MINLRKLGVNLMSISKALLTQLKPSSLRDNSWEHLVPSQKEWIQVLLHKPKLLPPVLMMLLLMLNLISSLVEIKLKLIFKIKINDYSPLNKNSIILFFSFRLEDFFFNLGINAAIIFKLSKVALTLFFLKNVSSEKLSKESKPGHRLKMN